LVSESLIRGQSAPQHCRLADDQLGGEIRQIDRTLFQQIQNSMGRAAAHVEDRLAHGGQRRGGVGRGEQIVEATNETSSGTRMPRRYSPSRAP